MSLDRERWQLRALILIGIAIGMMIAGDHSAWPLLPMSLSVIIQIACAPASRRRDMAYMYAAPLAATTVLVLLISLVI